MTIPLTDPWILLGVATAAAFLTRGVGIIVSGHVQPDTPLFEWCTCVGQALVGGLMIRAIFVPSTPLADIALPDRALALAVAFSVYFLAGRRLLAGTFAGVITLSTMVYWRGL